MTDDGLYKKLTLSLTDGARVVQKDMRISHEFLARAREPKKFIANELLEAAEEIVRKFVNEEL